MANLRQNAQTQCGLRINLDTFLLPADDMMILVNQRSWTPIPENFETEPVAWFEPFEDVASPVRNKSHNLLISLVICQKQMGGRALIE